MKNNDNTPVVPFYAYEGALTRADRANRRLCLIVGIISFVNAVAWLIGRHTNA